MSTTPIGTGAGVHQFDLVHPLFAHLHLINGRLLTHEQMAQDLSLMQPSKLPRSPGPAFGAGTAGGLGDGGLGISPNLPLQALYVPRGQPTWRRPVDARVPVGRSEAPPDPPPTSFGSLVAQAAALPHATRTAAPV